MGREKTKYHKDSFSTMFFKVGWVYNLYFCRKTRETWKHKEDAFILTLRGNLSSFVLPSTFEAEALPASPAPLSKGFML